MTDSEKLISLGVDPEREKEFTACDDGIWGWDGYHVEDAVAFARHYRNTLLEQWEKLNTAPRTEVL